MKSNDIVLSYGDRSLTGFIPQEWIDSGAYLPLIMPQKIEPIADPTGALSRALERPVGQSPPLKALVKQCFRGGDVAVLVDDYTRPNDHTRLLLPLLMEMLVKEYGIPANNIKVVICAGTHRSPTAAEMKRIVGEDMASRLHIVVHDCEKDLAGVGEMDGHPIMVNRVAFNADLLILLTDIDNHYFAGVAGGPKSLCPGVCGREIITWEHLHMFDDEGFADHVAPGVLDGNPVYECKKRIVGAIIAEMKKRGREVYCLAAITDHEGDLVYLEGGETFALHLAAAKRFRDVWTVRFERRPDVVIAGSQTLGVNLYQAGKTINAAYHAVARGGFILAVAPCADGFGDEEFRKLMLIAADVIARHTDNAVAIEQAKLKVLEAVRRDYRIGKQKAVDFLRILEFVGWGHLHMIQDGLSEEDKKILPFVFWGDTKEPAESRLKSWVLKYGAGRTLSVIDNPGCVVEVR